MARLGSDPHSLTAFGTGGAATRAGSGSPRPRVYPGQVEGHHGAESASLPKVPPVLAALAAVLQPAQTRGPRGHHTRMVSPAMARGGVLKTRISPLKAPPPRGPKLKKGGFWGGGG